MGITPALPVADYPLAEWGVTKMQVNITARHCNVPQGVRVVAEQRLQRLQRYEPRVDNAIVEFDADHGNKQVETRVFVKGSHSIIAHGSGETFRRALDQSLDRLTRQLKRRRERVTDHKSVKLSEVFAVSPPKDRVREDTHS
jgi:ribosomal subunit interface protein